MLGAGVIDRLPYWSMVLWDWFSRLFFGIVSALVWAVYCVSMAPVEHHHWISYLGKWLPLDFITPLQPLALAFAIALSIGWLLALPRLKSFVQWRGAFSWFAGITLMWGLAYTLLLPWADYAKSYEYTYQRLSDQVKPVWNQGDCLASVNLGESEAPMLFYYTGILHQPIDAAMKTECRWLLVQTPAPQGMPAGDWKPFWQGGRDGDTEQLFKLYERAVATAK